MGFYNEQNFNSLFFLYRKYKKIANRINEKVKGDIIEIELEKAYSDDYDFVVRQGKKEVDSDYRPTIKTKVDNIETYETIIICTPIWWYTLSPVMKSFLSSYDLTDKTIIPIITNGGYGLGHSIVDLKKLCPNSKIEKCLEIPFELDQIRVSYDVIDNWIDKLNIN